ncbi:MAG: 3-deoxy-8-phosphooctulonate synthase [Candidatus Omnitrophica bacterium]|jgi:2-dehydro-3-deoxyphosphooctonate aldolase (KDO 8-P synthase)|nr:3-deoxy-8-phosphooctulonate synthase [Candidatus Omnitrophota bacterium]MDD3274250.1 3-deoxy-8-phosphooctulonate synthase [Candidatus Omnitrophota bacterium]MDD5077493.1 3-deoxy-8-phosphooctulonate synthase [Candidatus Omnitrophota bacterium]MDD5724894.1 3-deoxy-8-phosphooctulonate synthase [Candidatus Omnitrophota bacterium]
MRQVSLGKIKFGEGCPLVLIAGPCAIESESSCLEAAARIKEIALSLETPFIFKSSFDKANRLSVDSYRGPGLKKGLAILKKIKNKLKLPILSDVHCAKDIPAAAEVLDIIQIPAFLCRQTDIVLAAARTGKIVNIKKGQFLAPWDIKPIIKKVESTGNHRILITERGVSFGYNNLVTDLRSLGIMRSLGYPVIYDATHSVQLPGGQGGCSGGQAEFVAGLSRAAVAFGCDGLFLEVHRDPKSAPCDGQNMINFKELEKLLKQVNKIRQVL